MGIKVSADGLSIVTTKSDGKCMATIPDVCKIPGPNGPIPVPFPNMVESKNGKMTSVMTEMDGGKVHCMGSYCEPSTGDEGGIMGGVVSGCTKGKAIYMKWSPTVKVEGRPVCRKSDLMIMNSGNTLGMAGMNQEDVGSVEGEDLEEELVPFKVQLKDGNEVRANVPYKLVALNKKIEGNTDGDGIIDVEIPKSALTLKILVNNDELIEFELGDPAEGKRGQQVALNNLGLYSGRIDSLIREKTKASVMGFQKQNGSAITGELESETQDKLKKQS